MGNGLEEVRERLDHLESNQLAVGTLLNALWAHVLLQGQTVNLNGFKSWVLDNCGLSDTDGVESNAIINLDAWVDEIASMVESRQTYG